MPTESTSPKPPSKKIDAFCGLTHPDQAALLPTDQARRQPTRLNVGRPGRGRELLDDTLQARVCHLVSYYPALVPYHAQFL